MECVFFGDFVAQNASEIILKEEIYNLIKSSDVAVCNFESPIEVNFDAFDRVGPRVNQSKEAPGLLKKWGFNVVQLANNHMLDFGDEGCKATIESFSDVVTVGAGTFNDAYSVKVITVGDKRIGFFSCVHHEFGVWDTKYSAQKMGTAWICHPLVQRKIMESKNNVDYLVVLPHAGVEETDAPIPEWRELYHSFIDWGADAVIGTHPHVPQGWEDYKGKPIFYSLGNFYFDALESHHPYWKRSIAVNLTFNDNEVTYKVYSIRYDNGVIEIDNEIDRGEYHKYLCDLLVGEKYLVYCDKMAREHWPVYQNWMVRSLGAFSFRLGVWASIKTIIYTLIKKRPSTLLVNILQCESHRWTILRANKL